MRYLFFGLLVLCQVTYTNCGFTHSDKNTLLFTICQERDVYDQSDYGEPPQFAIWLENKTTSQVQTVFVTYRTGIGNFEGKVECPVSLPAWIGAFRKETGRNDIPSIQNPADIITGATPKVPEFSTKIKVPAGSQWYYYVEVNVSGDYTPEFPALLPDGSIDDQGNGQPSIIYRGEITGTPGEKSIPELIGRTEQLYLSTEINPDLKGIRNAKDVFSKIRVTCI
ncbi:hypothetical protein ACFLSA_07235 [Bacteroidota bacterium]